MSEWYYVVGDQSFTYLTNEQKQYNALIIAAFLRTQGWTDIAIAGLLGNVDHEGILNPGQCEVGMGVPVDNSDTSYAGGIGLIQWTKPSGATINPLLKYASDNNKNWYDGDLQLEYILHADDSLNYGYWGWIQTASYPISFQEFSHLNTSASQAASAWLYNLERPGNPQASEPIRQQSAEEWLQYISFQPRLTMGDIYNSPYYTTWDAYYVSGVGMPNCTAYAFGRWNELCNIRHLHTDFPIHDGYQWYTDGIAKGFSGGMTPVLGSAACWYYCQRDEYGNLVLDQNGNPIPTGHVAIVEQINYDANQNPISFITSNSAWYRDEHGGIGNITNGFPYFYLNTISMNNLDNPWGTHPEGYFQGFLYNSNIQPPTPPFFVRAKKMPFIFYLKHHS